MDFETNGKTDRQIIHLSHDFCVNAGIQICIWHIYFWLKIRPVRLLYVFRIPIFFPYAKYIFSSFTKTQFTKTHNI